jgi:large subunit ribosomal protein L25
MSEKIHAAVPVVLKGTAKGQETGGVVQTGTREVEIESLPHNLPDVITVDISNLAMGEKLTVGDLDESVGYTVTTDRETVLVAIVAPRKLEETGPEETEPVAGEQTKTTKATPADEAAPAVAGDSEGS